jgi:hypothetical protein
MSASATSLRAAASCAASTGSLVSLSLHAEYAVHLACNLLEHEMSEVDVEQAALMVSPVQHSQHTSGDARLQTPSAHAQLDAPPLWQPQLRAAAGK